MTTPPTNAVSAVLLVDQRIQGYETIVSAVKSDVRCIVFDTNQVSEACSQQSITSFQYILNKIADLGVSSFANIGIVQHNSKEAYYQFFGVNPAELSTVAGVETADPSLQTWANVANFITTLKSTYGIQNVDLMACALYSNPDWKYIIDILATQTAVEIRASTDDTGAAELGGNWFLESHTGVNLKSVYFTDAIDLYKGLLKTILFNNRYNQSKSISPGNVLAWGAEWMGGRATNSELTSGVIAIYPVNEGFAALKTNGRVVTWPGDTSSISSSISSGIIAVCSAYSAFAVIKTNGSVVTWGLDSTSVNSSLTSGVVGLYSTDGAFAALKSDGSLITWGDAGSGGNSSSVSSSLTSGVVAVYSNPTAFAALKSNGSVVTWGSSTNGGNSSSVSSSLASGVVSVYSSYGAFAALKSNGSVITWGSDYGGYSSSVSNDLSAGVVTVYSNWRTFAALKTNGSLVTWGNWTDYGALSPTLTNVVAVYSTDEAFAALKTDGSVVTWGRNGGDSSAVSSSISSGVVTLSSTRQSFAALKSDGSVVSWGGNGGNSSSVSSSLTSGVVALYSSAHKFMALKNNGSVITWGFDYYGGGGATSTDLSSGIVAVYSAGYASAAIKSTATTFDLSMSYYTNMDRFDILRQKENRRRVDLTNLNNNVFTLSQTRDLQVINPNIPSGKTLRIIVPAYTSSSSYSITSSATIPGGGADFIIACNEGEPVTISGVNYVNYGSYIYIRESNNTYTKITSATIGGNIYNVYGGDGINSSGIALIFVSTVVMSAPTYGTFTPPAKVFGNASFSMVSFAPTSDSSGVYTYTSSAPGVATISSDGTVVTIVSAGSTTITVSQDICGNYSAGSKTGVFTVSGATPTYTPASPSASVTKTYGVDVSFSLTALVAGISNSNGAYTFSSASGAVSISGAVATILAYTPSAITITATQDASGNYASGSTAITVLVNRGTPTYQSVSPVTKTYGTDVSFSLTDVMAGISNSSGAYTFSSASDAISISGSVATINAYTPSAITITASQDASGNYAASSTSFSVLVISRAPTYQSVAQISKTYGTDVSFSLASFVAGISDSSGAYTFSSSSAAISISGDVVTILAYTPSAASITATQAAAGNYDAASTTLSLLVGRAAPTYQSVAQITKTFGVDVSFSLASVVAGISNSDGAYSTFSSASGAVQISGDVVTILAYTPEAVTITASQDASGNYASSSKTLSLLVSRGPPTYQSVAQISKTYGTDVSFSMTAVVAGVSNSDGAYTFSTSASADLISISGAVVTINAYTPSAVSITATQEASGNYTSSSTTVTLLVSRKVPSYGAFTLPAVTYEDAPYSLVSSAPTSESNAAYSYTSSNTAVATVNSAGTIVTVIGQGYTTITASQDASGNYAAGSTTASLLVNRAAPTFLKAFTITDKTFGDAAFSLLPFTDGLDNTDGTYHFSSSNASVVSISEADGVTATILAYSATPVTIYVAIDACGNYAASTTAGTLTINRKVPAYQAVSTVTKTFGDASFSLVSYMTGISESSGSYTFASSDASAVSIGGDGVTATILAYTASAITITATQAASGNYAAGTKTFSLTVARGAPTIGALGLGPLNGYYDVSNGYFTLTAPTSNSSGAFTYASDNSAVAVIFTGATMTTANLLARYDASVSSSYTLSGSNVTQWNDLTGNGYHLGTYEVGPTVSTINSVPAMEFNYRRALICPFVPLTSSVTVFMVIRYSSNVEYGGSFMHHGSRDTDWAIERAVWAQPTQSLSFQSNNDLTAIDTVINTNYILVGRIVGNTRQFWTYSDTQSPSYVSSTPVTITPGNKTIFVGKSENTSASEACNSRIGEILYYNASLSDADLSANLVYLQNKWINNTTSSASTNVRLLTAGTANISATQDICGNYSTGSVSSLLRVGATVPTFGTFTVSSTTKTYGDGAFTITPPTSNSNGAFTITSSNSSIVSISGTTATIVAGGTVDITVTQDPSGSFTRKSVTSSFTVQPKNPNLRNFPAIVKSFADGSFTVTPPDTDGPGYFTYTASPVGVLTGGGMMNPSFGIVNGGSTVITAAQVGSQNYAASSITAAVTVTPILPSASYSNFTRAFDVGSFTIPAPTTANSGSSVSYTSSDLSVATISGSTVTVRKVGETTITATIAANSAYLVRDISAVLTVTIGTPSMNGLYNQTLVMTQAPYTLSPTSSSNGTFSYVSDNSAVVFMTDSGTTFNVARVGTANITATISQDPSANYNARTSTFVITVNRATSNLSSRTFAVPALMTYGDTPVNITTVPISDSSGAITYTSANTNLATIHPTTGLITALGAGGNYFIASQAETDVHNASTVQSNYMQISSKAVTLSRAAPYTSSTITKYYGDAPFELSSTSESNAGKSYSPSNYSVVSLTVPSTSAYITINNVGTVVITGQQFGNSQYSIQNQVMWTLTVEKGTTALTGLAATLSKNVTDAPFTVAVSSASGGTKTYALSNPADSSVLTVNSSSGVVTLRGAGTATIVASQALSTLYNAPASVSCVVTVAAAGSTLQGATITSARTFDNVDMSGASLSGTTVTGVSFAGAVLTNAVLTGATLTNSTMTSTDLSGASMANTIISGTSFAGATMTSAVLTGATFTNSTLTSVGLVGASMANTDISGTSFASSTMTRAILTGATLTGSTLTSTDLSGASMSNTTITRSTFTSATMTNAVLTGATLTNSTLTSTVLTGASLARANVTGSTFVGASLANADLSGATVTNANFTNANISGADITNVAFSPLQKIQLLKNTNNRAIGGIQVGDVPGSTLLSAISESSPAVSIPNIADAVVKVVIPTTSTVSSDTLPNVTLDTTANDKFYFPINEGEYFQILGVKYYTDGGLVKNAATNATVQVISYGNKSIWLIAGSIIASVLATNTISQSTFTVPTGKMDTDAPFNITVAPTSNSDATIVYSSNNTSVATIHPSTGVITIVGQGYVNFIATQAATLLYEPGTKMSNELFVNKLINFTLSGLNQTITMTTSGLLDGAAIELEATDATAVFYVKTSDMTDLFKFQTDSQSSNNDTESDIKYYVFNRKWPAALKINPAHAMLNKTESSGMLGTTDLFAENKMLTKHDFLRYLSLRLFNTIHGVDLFSNESDLLENTTYWGEDVRANIRNILAGISTTSSDAGMSYDASGNKYLTDAVTADTNICRELMRQLTAGAASRFGSVINSTLPQSIPLMENDSINFKVTIQSAPSQNILTGVEEIPARSYMVKLVLKDSVSGGGGNSNTVVADSEMYPNAYPYSSAVTSYAPSAASSAVYNSYSPPAPMPFARFGFDGWYYTNSTAWVTSAYRNHIKWLMPANSGSATVGSLQYIRVNLKIHNKVALPYIMVYTQSTSSRKYTVTNTGALVNGTTYSFYVNFNSYTSAPATAGFTNAAMSNTENTGSFGSNELILNVALETAISAAAGTVDFTLSSVVIGDNVAGEKEYGFEADVPVAYP